MNELLFSLKKIIWGFPLLTLLFGVSVYLTFILRFIQFRYLPLAIRQIFTKNNSESKGDISHFESLMTSLAAAIGTGSIVGIATAISFGGLGALFWMWVTAIFGMATKYSESLLAVKYRETDSRGEMVGGPMEYIQKGLGWKKTATLFALLGAIAAFGTGNLVQVNSIADALNNTWRVNPWITGIILSTLTGFVLIGGVKSIGKVASILVPSMALFYIIGGIAILILNVSAIPGALSTIFFSAFNGQAASGGFLGATVMMAIQMGISRSVFSSEAGLGISSIAAAAAKTDKPARQALIAMTGVLLSTVIVCTITGLVIAVTHVLGETSAITGQPLNGASMAIEAFNRGVPGSGFIVTVGLILFAYSTVLAWAYYGEKCCEYLFGDRSIIFYRVFYTLCIIPGAALDMEIVWNFADIANGLIAIPNLIALVALAKIIKLETFSFLKEN